MVPTEEVVPVGVQMEKGLFFIPEGVPVPNMKSLALIVWDMIKTAFCHLEGATCDSGTDWRPE